MRRQSFYIFVGCVTVALVLLYFYGKAGWPLKREGFSGSGSGYNLTMYYVDWCPHCQSAKPDFEALRDASPVDVNGHVVEVGLVNPEKTPELTQGKPIKGYPTVILTKPSGEFVEYNGERNKSGYMSFLQSNVA